MAINPNILAGLVSSEIVAEFNLGQSNEQLDKYAAAISRAISKYLDENVQVATGIQIQGQARISIPGPTMMDPPTEVVATVTGQTVTPGDLF